MSLLTLQIAEACLEANEIVIKGQQNEIESLQQQLAAMTEAYVKVTEHIHMVGGYIDQLSDSKRRLAEANTRANTIQGDEMRTVYIRNTRGGLIWQVYHVKNRAEYQMLSNTATANGFRSIEICPYDETDTETFPDWRDTEVWKERWAKESLTYSESDLADFKEWNRSWRP